MPARKTARRGRTASSGRIQPPSCSRARERRNLALAAGKMGSWDWDLVSRRLHLGRGQGRIFGVAPGFAVILSGSCASSIHQRRHRSCSVSALKGAPPGARFKPANRVSPLPVPTAALAWCPSETVAASEEGRRSDQTRISGVTIGHHRPQGGGGAPGCCWRERSTTAPRTHSPWCMPSCQLARAPTTLPSSSPPSKGRVQRLPVPTSLLSESRWQGAKVSPTSSREELAPYRAPQLRPCQDFRNEALPPSIPSHGPGARPGAPRARHQRCEIRRAVDQPSGRASGFVGAIETAGSNCQWIERGGPTRSGGSEPGGFGPSRHSSEPPRRIQLDGKVREFDWRAGRAAIVRCPFLLRRSREFFPNTEGRQNGTGRDNDALALRNSAAQTRSPGRRRDAHRHDDGRAASRSRSRSRRPIRDGQRRAGGRSPRRSMLRSLTSISAAKWLIRSRASWRRRRCPSSS